MEGVEGWEGVVGWKWGKGGGGKELLIGNGAVRFREGRRGEGRWVGGWIA